MTAPFDQTRPYELLPDGLPDHRFFLKDATLTAFDAAAAMMVPPEPLDNVAFAINHWRFSTGEQQGPYMADRFPMFNEILKAVEPDDPCRTVTMVKAAQLGGTAIAIIAIAARLALEPCLILNYHPSDENAKTFWEDKWIPETRHVPICQENFNYGESASGVSRVGKMDRQDGRGSFSCLHANSSANLSQRTSPFIILDDLVKFNVLPDAGDSEKLAEGRAGSYDEAKILKISTPLVVPGCRISRSFDEGTQEEWTGPCPHCGTKQVLVFENFRFDKENPGDCWFQCVNEACAEGPEKGQIRNEHQYEFNASAAFVAKYPERAKRHRSFRVPRWIVPLRSWQSIAEAWLDACGNPDQEQVFYNEVCGIPFKVDTETPNWEDIADRANAQAVLPQGMLPEDTYRLYVGLDVQGDRLEYQVIAIRPKMRVHTVEYGVIYSTIDDPETLDAVIDLFKRTYRTPSGRVVSITKGAIDSGYKSTEVHEFVIKSKLGKNVFVPVKGRPDEDYVIKPSAWKADYKKSTQSKLKIKRNTYLVGTWAAKARLMHRIKCENPSKHGYMSFCTELPNSFYQGLCSNYQRLKKDRHGNPVFQWFHDDLFPDEPLDTLIYAWACAYWEGLHVLTDDRWDEISDDLLAEAGLTEDLFSAAVEAKVAEQKKAKAAPVKPDLVADHVARPTIKKASLSGRSHDRPKPKPTAADLYQKAYEETLKRLKSTNV